MQIICKHTSSSKQYEAPCPRRSLTKRRIWVSTIAIIISRWVTSESPSKAAGTAPPAAARNRSAAAASVWAFPSALGWSVQLGRFWSYSWETEPHRRPAAVGSAAKASVFHTSCSLGAWSVGRQEESSQCFNLLPAFLLLRYMEQKEPRRDSLKPTALKCSYMKRTTMEAERLPINTDRMNWLKNDLPENAIKKNQKESSLV